MTTQLRIRLQLCLGLTFASLFAGAQTQTSGGQCTSNCGYDWQTNGGVTSSSTNMVSHRFQRHSVVTADGYIHIIVNTGAPTTISGSANSGALELFTSPNNGQNWYPTFIFSGTVGTQTNTTVSTDDIRLVSPGMGQYLEVAYDVQPNGSSSAVMFTELSYNPSNSTPGVNTWMPMTGYPESVVSNTSGTVYQQPALGVDGPGNIWLTDFEIPAKGLSGGQGTGGQIGVYEYSSNPNTTTWVNTGLGNSLPCNGSSAANAASGASPNVTCPGNQDYSGLQHAARPVFVPYSKSNTSMPANIGILYQSGNCLFWVTVNVTNTSPVSAAQELSSASNQATGTSGCNLPSLQSGYEDTAASIATNPVTGDQYLGFAVMYSGSANSNAPAATPTSVYTLTYQASNASWIDGQLLTGPSTAPYTPVYVKTALVQALNARTASAYTFINYGTNSPIEVLTSPLLSQGATNYTQLGVYNHNSAITTMGQSYANPRIETPEYVNSNNAPNISTVPLWEQYTSSMPTSSSVPIQSLIYWNNVPN